jgi:drug/metabolite transporter (DMT)-like permease
MVAFLGSLKLTTVAHVAIIYATIPFVLAALAYWIVGERTSPATLIASGVAGCGGMPALANGMGKGSVVGDALAVAMTVFMAAMIVMVRRAQIAIDMIPAACLSAVGQSGELSLRLAGIRHAHRSVSPVFVWDEQYGVGTHPVYPRCTLYCFRPGGTDRCP